MNALWRTIVRRRRRRRRWWENPTSSSRRKENRENWKRWTTFHGRKTKALFPALKFIVFPLAFLIWEGPSARSLE